MYESVSALENDSLMESNTYMQLKKCIWSGVDRHLWKISVRSIRFDRMFDLE